MQNDNKVQNENNVQNEFILNVSNYNNQRLDKYISDNSDLSRSMIVKIIENNKCFVNGVVQSKNYKVQNGDIIKYSKLESSESSIKKQNLSLDILYQDKDILVINKPKSMVVHPGAGNHENTLVNGLLYHIDDLSGIGGIIRPGIVHRIDKDTTGVLIIAKNDKAHLKLSEDFKNHEVKKTYLALVKNIIEESIATINIPISRSKTDRKKMATSKDGKNAITHFEVIQRFESSNTTFIKVNIETGRTHQIRVHMAHIKHPIIGDTTYSNGKNKWNISGQLLHSYNIEFKHPISGKQLSITAPLPDYFKDILNEEILDNNISNKVLDNILNN